MKDKTVVIIGRGRCGTSAVAGIIDRLGYKTTGTKEKTFTHGLLRGYYEKEEVSDFINSNCGSDKIKEGEPTKEFKESFKPFKGKVIKNHRIIYLLPWILKEDPDTKIIMCYRNLERQAKSINDACWNNKKKIRDIKQSIIDYEKEIDKMNLKKLDIYFEDLIEKPEEVVRKIANYLGKGLRTEAIEFIKPEYSKYGIY